VRIPERRYSWSTLDLFRFSAATGNAHRIHYDVEHARSEGLPSVVVHTTLHAMMLWQTLTAVVDEHAVRHFQWRNHAPLAAGREVVVSGTAESTDTGWVVLLEERRTDDGTTMATGRAIVAETNTSGA
jgi:hydroxyacyl-ACP dehydratase HTD2-like protein with hotdog domain